MVAGDRIRCHLLSDEKNKLNIGKKEKPRTFGLEGGWDVDFLYLDLDQKDMI